MKNVKKVFLLMVIVFCPMLFTACEQDSFFDEKTSIIEDSDDIAGSEDEID